MKKWIWPLLVIFFLLGGLAAILIGQVTLPPGKQYSLEEISEKWGESGHADSKSESFTHWDEDDPAVVPANCAKCHSGYGYLDYLGEDGSQAGIVDSAAQTGLTVTCFVCHNTAAHEKDTAVFPSGAVIESLEETANCAECHQGTNAGTDVENAVADLPEDEVNAELRFVNVHYIIGGAVRFGAEVTVGYEYPGLSYAGFYHHVEDYQVCTDCHDPHSLDINPSECAACHTAVSDYTSLLDIRVGSTPDYDGDDDISEGVYGELSTMHQILYTAIQQYAGESAEGSILYSSSYPYWFQDSNENGVIDEDESSYASWTPRLLKAAYNYHLVLQDPGGFTHNAVYLIQLMYDSTADLAEVSPIDISGLIRP
jgi:hypothetical protein